MAPQDKTWVVKLVKSDRRANVMYGKNYFPRRFKTKREAIELVSKLNEFQPAIQATIEEVVS